MEEKSASLPFGFKQNVALAQCTECETYKNLDANFDNHDVQVAEKQVHMHNCQREGSYYTLQTQNQQSSECCYHHWR